MRVAKPRLYFIQDTREQWPIKFAAPVRREFSEGGTIIKGLGEGDYSVSMDAGVTIMPIRIERKSLGDLYGCIPHEPGCQKDCGKRCRFERELDRLRAYEYRAIVVEASADDILRGYERSQISPRAAMASLCCWSVQFGIAVWLAESHRRAGGIVQRLLEEFAAHTFPMRAGGGVECQATDSQTKSAPK